MDRLLSRGDDHDRRFGVGAGRASAPEAAIDPAPSSTKSKVAAVVSVMSPLPPGFRRRRVGDGAAGHSSSCESDAIVGQSMYFKTFRAGGGFWLKVKVFWLVSARIGERVEFPLYPLIPREDHRP